MSQIEAEFKIQHSVAQLPKDININTNLNLPKISTIPATPTKTIASSIGTSTSTDESRDERSIPIISTNTEQDEIVKLSSNISNPKSDEDKVANPPLNETMC